MLLFCFIEDKLNNESLLGRSDTLNFSTIYNVNKRQFNSTLKREKITVTDYWDNTKTYDVFFRRDKRGTTPQGKLRFYYAQSTPITTGTIFLLKGVPYLVISQDGIESDVYYTSMAVKCDTSFDVYMNKKYYRVPCAVISDKFTLTHGSVISMVSGSVTVYTTDNQYSEAIEINDGYENFGGYYEVGNRFFNNGLAYIYMERTTKPADTWSLTYDGVNAFDITGTEIYQLSYTAIKNNRVIDEPTITYTSSDESIATVDSTGLMTILDGGTVTITATWTDGNNTQCTTVMSITEEPVSTVRGEITASSYSIKVAGSYKTMTLTLYNENDEDVTSDYTASTFTWTCSVDDEDLTDKVTWLAGSKFNQMRVKFSDDRSYLGKYLTVKCVVDDSIIATLDFEITA